MSRFQVLHKQTVHTFDFFVLLLCTMYVYDKYLKKQYTAKDTKCKISANERVEADQLSLIFL